MTNEVLTGPGPAATPSSETGTSEAAQGINAATAEAQTGGAEGGEESQDTPKTFTQQELDEIVRRRVAKAEAKAERRVMRTLERLVPQQAAQTQPQTQQRSAPLARLDGESDAEFVTRAVRAELEQRDKRTAAERAQSQEVQIAQKTQSLLDQAAKLPGFDMEAFHELPISEAMAAAILDSEVGAKVVHHLTLHPEEADRIAKFSPARQAAELGKLEATLAKAGPKTSKTPDPVGDPTAKGSPTSVPTDPARMSMQQYQAWRKQQGAQWAR